ncbi:unnamed protein product [Clonostachys byssicola]|uniref:Heterokaryon incompatibility domain-containing protein n=1 Tax=Clonostachys byssicola TaxID=160290 RepID=A0A9N9UAA3_9HYPO|nr:unnamed protein product [Clonostachys byssicola]
MEELRRNYFTRTRKPYPTDLLFNEIRLVALLPGKWNDDVQCELFRVSDRSGTKRPPYQALSYAWGAPGQQASHIQVNDCEFAVTANLGVALRFLRDNKEPIVLWIDALCINQQNDRERSSQVAKMRDIYKAANQVIIFLGDGSSHITGKSLRRDPGPCVQFTGDDLDEDLIKQYMRKWASSLTTKRISAPEIFCLIAIFSRQMNCLEFLKEIPVHYLAAILEAVRTMLTARWWDRIWVVQEAVVADHLVVRYGNACMPWMMLATVANLYHQGVIWNCPDSFSSDDAKVLRLLTRVRDLDYFRQTWRGQSGNLDLLALLRQFSNRHSSDSRDKIFALLGLCDQTQTLSPDYSWDEVMVYAKYTIQMIQQKKSLSPLNGDIGRKNGQDIPSWVPDWKATFDESDRGRLALTELYDASGGVDSTIWVVNDLRRPRCCGIHDRGPFFRGRRNWQGWDLDTATSQAEEGMLRLIESLENENRPEAYLPIDAKSSLELYERSFKCVGGCDRRLQSLFNKLSSFCHPDGQRHPTRFINHSLLTVWGSTRNDCEDGALTATGRFVGTVSKVFESLYSCNDTEAVLNETKCWFVDWFKFSVGRDYNPSDSSGDYNPLHFSTVFAETLLSSAKITEKGIQRLEIQDKTHLVSWLWRVVWRGDPAKQIHHPSHTPSLVDEDLPDPLVAESYSATMRLSITKRVFFFTKDGRIGMGPISMRESDEIYVLPGGKMPFVLRRIPHQKDDGRRATPLAFSLVGECYLHGCMDGQMGLPNEGGISDYNHWFKYELPEKSETNIRWIALV